jgi:hypothetical protein
MKLMKRKPGRKAARSKVPKRKAAAGKAVVKKPVVKKPVAKQAAKAIRPNSPKIAPAKPADAVDTLVVAGAQALKLPLDPAWHSGVKFNLHLILRLAALVDEFPLPDDAEPAPVFHA